MEVPFTEVQKYFDKFLKIVEIEEVVITINDECIAKMVSCKDSCFCNDDGHFINEEALDYDAGLKSLLTYEEFCILSENSELRYELIDGEVYLLASPNYKHQVAIGELYVTFYNYFKGKKCRPLTSPFDVTLYKSKKNINVVQPDIIVMCDTENIDSKGKYKGIPTLVLEVLSPSTRNKDMKKKFELFKMTGVSEYWMVDVEKKTIYIYQFKGNNAINYKVFDNVESAESFVFDGLKVRLEDVFIA